MIPNALNIHFSVNMDSALASTREFWRKKAGLPDAIVKDPRKLSEIVAELEASQPKGGA